MLLLHCLAEIKDQKLLFDQRVLQAEDDPSSPPDIFTAQWDPPMLEDDFLLEARFDIDGNTTGEVGIQLMPSIDTDPDNAAFMSCHLQSGLWQVLESNLRNDVKLFEKRGRQPGRWGKQITCCILSLGDQYYFYIQDMETPAFQCPRSVFSGREWLPALLMREHDMPILASMRIWKLKCLPKGSLSLSHLLAAQD